MDVFDNIQYTIDTDGKITVKGNLFIYTPLFD